MAEKNITLGIGGKDYRFKVTTALYNKFCNDIKDGDRVSPAKNLVISSVAEESADASQAAKTELRDLFDQGLALDIAGNLIEAFRPKLEIEVKN